MKNYAALLVVVLLAFSSVSTASAAPCIRILHKCSKPTPTPTATPSPTPVPTPTATPGPAPTWSFITNSDGDCLDVWNQTAVVLAYLDIGPCGAHGIQVYASSGVIIHDVRIHDTGATGIDVLESTNTTIKTATIQDTERQLIIFDQSNIGNVSSVNVGLADAWPTKVGWDGLSSYRSSNIVIESSEVRGGNLDSGCGIIIDGDGGVGNVIRNNVIVAMVNCSIGVSDGSNALIEGNRVSGCLPAGTHNACIYIWEQYLPAGNCVGNTIRNNTVNDTNPFWSGNNCVATVLSGNSW